MIFSINKSVCYGEEISSPEEQIDEILSGINEEDFSEVVKELNSLFGANLSFKDLVYKFFTGELGIDYSNIKNYLTSKIFSLTYENINSIVAVVTLAVLMSITNIIITKNQDSIENNLTYFIVYPIIVTLIVGITSSTLNYSLNIIKNQTKLLESVFPIMFSVTTLIGNFGVTAIKPYTIFLGFLSQNLVNSVFIPILTFATVVLIVGNLSNNLKLNNLFKTLLSLFKWLIGIITIVFTLLTTISGLSSSQHNGLSIKILKYITGTSIPIVGGMVSGSVDVVLSTSILVKNSIGAIASVFIISKVLVSGINILVFSFIIKFICGIFEGVIDSRISTLVNGVDSILKCIASLIFIIGFLYIITICFLIFATINIF